MQSAEERGSPTGSEVSSTRHFTEKCSPKPSFSKLVRFKRVKKNMGFQLCFPDPWVLLLLENKCICLLIRKVLHFMDTKWEKKNRTWEPLSFFTPFSVVFFIWRLFFFAVFFFFPKHCVYCFLPFWVKKWVLYSNSASKFVYIPHFFYVDRQKV